MSQVNVTINGRAYEITCDDGHEQHLSDLANFVDRRVGELVSAMGQIGDSRLLVLTSLMIADELNNATASLQRYERGSERAERAAQAAENTIADVIDGISERVEALTSRLQTR